MDKQSKAELAVAIVATIDVMNAAECRANADGNTLPLCSTNCTSAARTAGIDPDLVPLVGTMLASAYDDVSEWAVAFLQEAHQ